MKSERELQIIINELSEVCKRHNVMLIGSCFSEGIDGEILIVDDPKTHSYIDSIDEADINHVHMLGDQFVVNVIA
jgi:hypothetical protein